VAMSLLLERRFVEIHVAGGLVSRHSVGIDGQFKILKKIQKMLLKGLLDLLNVEPLSTMVQREKLCQQRLGI